MTKILFSILFILTLFSCIVEPQPTSIEEAVDLTVYPHIALGSNVGVIVGIIKNGKTYTYSYGQKEIGKKEKLTTTSVLEVASLTKTFTALALADMHLKGELNLDDPIEMYFPPSVKIPFKNGKKITLRHLANHTSGFPRDASNMDEEAFNQYKDYSEEKMFEFINSFDLPHEPGSKYQYSNVGYGLLGHILSVKNKTSYEKVIKDRILTPFGMKNTSVSLTEQQAQNLAPGHNGNKKVESWSQYMQEIFHAAGALRSDLDDQLIYLKANLENKPSPLQEAITLVQQETFKMSGPYQNAIALGWYFNRGDNHEIIWKNGQNGGYSSFMGFDKKENTGVVILCNSSLHPDPFQTTMGMEILEKLRAVEQ